MMTQNRKNFRKLILKAFGLLTGNYQFQTIRIRVNSTWVSVWDARTEELIRYMIDKNGDFRNIHSLQDIRRVVRQASSKSVPKPRLRNQPYVPFGLAAQ
ncbi:MAG: hypothetical protein SVX43_08825 [Cyanobacteriota bacterium]|nr:hypothetical protein [Cyanobacteriota bacterium]